MFKTFPRLQYCTICLLTLWSALALSSCSKDAVSIDSQGGHLVPIQVSIQESSYESIKNIGSPSSNISYQSQLETDYLPLTQTSTLPFGNDYLLVAELSPASVDAQSEKIAATGKKAHSEIVDLGLQTRYKLLVYDQSGVYITERDYVRGQEGSAEPLHLPTGKSYTFVAYCINSNTDLPAVTFTNIANKTILTSTLLLDGVNDYMYFRKDVSLSGNGTHQLGIILKHRFSQITTTINSSATGYNITAVNSSFGNHWSNATISLINGDFVRSGTSSSSSVKFNSPNGNTVQSEPTIVNASENLNVPYQIASMTIGSLTQTNLTPFSDLNIIPGVKYNLRINVVPADQFLTHRGQPAARIAGKIWMRHNLGANTALDPDALPMTSDRHGDYFQWGKSVRSASATENNASNFNNTNNPNASAWNLGTELVPIKGLSDPCPAGYRVPSRSEQQSLLSNTLATNEGTYMDDSENFGAAKVLTSQRNKHVKLTFPIQGIQNASGGTTAVTFRDSGINYRGHRGYYFSNYSSGTQIGFMDFTVRNATTTVLAAHNRNKAVSRIIRCIAE